MYLDNERRSTLTPQLAVRVAILAGGIALAAFGIIFFRLWFLQVLSAADYVRAAQNNQERETRAGAARRHRRPRGARAGGEPRRPGGRGHAPDKLSADRAERQALYRRLAHC